MRLVDDQSRIEWLDRDDCVRLLATQQVGRLAFVVGGAPEVLPVNYVLDGEAVVFATAAGTKLSFAERGPVAFEVDDTDAATRVGWSVVVRGRAHVVTELDAPGTLERLRALPLSPWAGGERPHLVRIEPTAITGRRVGRA